MSDIGIGLVGGGYMGKAHAVALSAVGAVFDTPLRPRLEVIAATSPESAERYRKAYGFARATADWRDLVADPKVQAVVIASPQSTHRAIAEAAFAAGKPVFCEKPLGASLEDAQSDGRGGRGFGPAEHDRLQLCPHARHPVRPPVAGRRRNWPDRHGSAANTPRIFSPIPPCPPHGARRAVRMAAWATWHPIPINCMLALMGPVAELSARIETVHATRPGPDGPVAVDNDDQAQLMLRFASGVMGHLFVSRVATGRKMGYAYEIHGTKGSIRFDQEDQNAVWLYRAEGPEATRGFTRILTGPLHPDYLPFCQGPGHGTGYQDQIIIEAGISCRPSPPANPSGPPSATGLDVSLDHRHRLQGIRGRALARRSARMRIT